MTPVLPFADIITSITSVFDAISTFWQNLAAVNWVALLIGLCVFVIYQSFRSRAAWKRSTAIVAHGHAMSENSTIVPGFTSMLIPTRYPGSSVPITCWAAG